MPSKVYMQVWFQCALNVEIIFSRPKPPNASWIFFDSHWFEMKRLGNSSFCSRQTPNQYIDILREPPLSLVSLQVSFNIWTQNVPSASAWFVFPLGAPTHAAVPSTSNCSGQLHLPVSPASGGSLSNLLASFLMFVFLGTNVTMSPHFFKEKYQVYITGCLMYFGIQSSARYCFVVC